jgi:5-methylthioribose kinase
MFGLINVLVTTTTTSQTNRRTTELTTRTQEKNAELAAQTQRDLAEVSFRTQEQISNSNSERNIKLEEIKSQLQAQRDEKLEWREHKKTIAKYKDPLMHAGFAAEARRQSLLVAQSPEEADIQAFIDSVVEWPDDETSQ